MKTFMLLFRGSIQNEQAFLQQTPEEMQKEMALWNVWMEGIAKQGKLIGGEPLFPHGKVLRGTAKTVTDGPFTEGKDICGGYLVIKSESYDDAVAISKGCPTLNADSGSVEVREIMPIS